MAMVVINHEWLYGHYGIHGIMRTRWQLQQNPTQSFSKVTVLFNKTRLNRNQLCTDSRSGLLFTTALMNPARTWSINGYRTVERIKLLHFHNLVFFDRHDKSCDFCKIKKKLIDDIIRKKTFYSFHLGRVISAKRKEKWKESDLTDAGGNLRHELVPVS